MTPMVDRVCRNCGVAFQIFRRHSYAPNAGVFCGRSCHGSDILRRRNADQRGEKNPHWKGGVSKDGMRYAKRFRLKSPEKVAAQRLFREAVKSGRIVRASECSACGIPCKAHGHHDDYNKPYEVRWLCQPCHNRHHAAMRRVAA